MDDTMNDSMDVTGNYPTNKISVLIVEDDPLLRSVLALGIQAEDDLHVCGTAQDGLEALEPGLMSLIRTVPAAVPSLFHNSVPLVGSVAWKKRVPLTLARLFG